VVGVGVVVGAAVVVAAAVVVGAAVVVAAAVVVGVAVVAGVAVSEPPRHPKATNKNTSATAYFLITSVCHPSQRGGGWGDIGAPTYRYAQPLLPRCVFLPVVAQRVRRGKCRTPRRTGKRESNRR